MVVGKVIGISAMFVACCVKMRRRHARARGTWHGGHEAFGPPVASKRKRWFGVAAGHVLATLMGCRVPR